VIETLHPVIDVPVTPFSWIARCSNHLSSEVSFTRRPYHASLDESGAPGDRFFDAARWQGMVASLEAVDRDDKHALGAHLLVEYGASVGQYKHVSSSGPSHRCDAWSCQVPDKRSHAGILVLMT